MFSSCHVICENVLVTNKSSRNVVATRNGDRPLMGKERTRLHAKCMSTSPSPRYNVLSRRRLISRAIGYGKVEYGRSMLGGHSIIPYMTVDSV